MTSTSLPFQHERHLTGLYENYVESSRRHSTLRQQQVEQLGDSLCDRSLAPPSEADRLELEQLARAERAAHEQYLRCVATTAQRLIWRLGSRRGATGSHRPGGRGSAHVQSAGPAR